MKYDVECVHISSNPIFKKQISLIRQTRMEYSIIRLIISQIE